jgi:hypothetical protein
MPGLKCFRYDIWVPARIHANAKEGTFYIKLTHGVQQFFGARLARPVIEGKSDLAHISRPMITKVPAAAVWWA